MNALDIDRLDKLHNEEEASYESEIDHVSELENPDADGEYGLEKEAKYNPWEVRWSPLLDKSYVMLKWRFNNRTDLINKLISSSKPQPLTGSRPVQNINVPLIATEGIPLVASTFLKLGGSGKHNFLNPDTGELTADGARNAHQTAIPVMREVPRPAFNGGETVLVWGEKKSKSKPVKDGDKLNSSSTITKFFLRSAEIHTPTDGSQPSWIEQGKFESSLSKNFHQGSVDVAEKYRAEVHESGSG